MTQQTFIGIDPDSTSGTVCIYKPSDEKTTFKRFYATRDGLEKMIAILKPIPECIIGVEGTGGYSAPFEKAFADAGIPFYAIPAFRIDSVRKGLIGENKNNEADAAAVVHTLHSMFISNTLEKYNGVYNESMRGLKLLTRTRSRFVWQQTELRNTFYTIVHAASTELSMFLSDQHPTEDGYAYSMPVIRLFKNKPNIAAWKNLSDKEFIESMETGKRAVTLENIENMRKIVVGINNVSREVALSLQSYAGMIIANHNAIAMIEDGIHEATADNRLVNDIYELKGIGKVTAAAIVAEIQDKLFKNDDNLASYAGLCRREHKTGDGSAERKRRHFNRYLKNAFMQAARGMKGIHGEAMIRSYYKSLLKRGMKKVEAQKRIARGLARKVFLMMHPKEVK